MSAIGLRLSSRLSSLIHQSPLSALSPPLTDVLGSAEAVEFLFSIVSSSVSQPVMQFSGSSDHINHLSSNFNSPLLLIEQKYRH